MHFSTTLRLAVLAGAALSVNGAATGPARLVARQPGGNVAESPIGGAHDPYLPGGYQQPPTAPPTRPLPRPPVSSGAGRRESAVLGPDEPYKIRNDGGAEAPPPPPSRAAPPPPPSRAPPPPPPGRGGAGKASASANRGIDASAPPDHSIYYASDELTKQAKQAQQQQQANAGAPPLGGRVPTSQFDKTNLKASSRTSSWSKVKNTAKKPFRKNSKTSEDA